MTKSMVVSIPENAFTEKKLLFCIHNGYIPRNAISWAAENGYTEITQSLIQLGADVKENRNYPLELASRNGHIEIVKMLLEAGANTCDSEPDEGYCLRMAARFGNMSIVKLLLEAGANPMADHYFALRLALEEQYIDVADVLMDAICKKRANI